MRASFAGIAVLAAIALSGCQPDFDDLQQVTPPEYVQCRELRDQLSESDAIVRALDARDTTSEAQYWRDRKQRLIARAYECSR